MKPYVDCGLRCFSVVIPNLNRMRAANGLPPHHFGDLRVTPPGETVRRSADEEVRVGRMRRVKQLEDVAVAVADMDAASGVATFMRGTSHVGQPAVAFLLLGRDGCRVDHPLARHSSL